MDMDESTERLQREVLELRSGVKRLRRCMEGVITVAFFGLMVIIPNLWRLCVILGVVILFGFLVSRQRRLIFEYLFQARKTPPHRN